MRFPREVGDVAPCVHSFDVFDTVLTRRVGDPAQVFHQAAQALSADGTLDADATAVAMARHAAELRLFRLLGRPPRIREVHEELAATLGLPAACIDVMLDAELGWERRLSVAVPGMSQRLREARAQGRVVFVSDTTLSEPFVQELLAQSGLWEDGDAVYTSADRGEAKGIRGGLYDVVASELAVPPARIVHVGDHRFADVGEARLKGWTAGLSSQARLNRYERILEEESAASAGLSSYLAGASRLARLTAAERGVDRDLAAVAAGVAAPLLVGYALWVLQQAREQELDRLYFVARDGQVMLEVTRSLAAALGADVELRYLYGSRTAWHLASLHGQDVEDLSYWLHGHRGEPAREVLQRVGLTPERAHALVADPVLDPATADVPLSATDLTRLHELVSREPLLAEVRATAAERHALMRDHLRQEGLGDDVRTGIVDVGWLGRSGRSLDDAMRSAGFPRVVSFLHIGLAAGASTWVTEAVASRMRAYLFDQLRRSGLPGAPSGVIGVIEMFCTGSEGSVSGYRRHGDRVVPVLVRPVHEEAVAWGLHEMRATIDDVVSALTASGAALDRPGDLRGAIDGVLREFWERPTDAEIARWGTFPFEAAQTHDTSAPLAAPVSTRQVLKDLRAGRIKLRPATSWRAGTAALSAPPWRLVLHSWAWAERNTPRLRRLPHRARLELALRRSQ